jgi:pyridoxine 5-phosphate synthase
VPSLVEAVQACVDAGAPGITVHPRGDQRHIRPQDVYEISKALESVRGRVEYNIEGDPRPELVELVQDVRPDQCTLVPVRPGELTSEAGWAADTPRKELAEIIRRFRIELYTEPYARAFERGGDTLSRSLNHYRTAVERAIAHGLGVNAGHDLDLQNLPTFLTLPGIDEVSIGHALMARAMFVGLAAVVAEYLEITGAR